MILLAIALQAATPPAATAPPPVPERFSILLPDCAKPASDKDVVVCARAPNGNRLPLPDDRAPPAGRGANRELSAGTALALQAPPCSATMSGCLVGFGPPLMPLIKGAANAVKAAFAKKPDKSGRIPIPLDDGPLPATP